MVFLGGITKLSIVNLHLQPSHCSGGNKLIFLILDNGHTPLFRNYLHWANPLAIQDRVDDPGVKQFGNHFLTTSCMLGFKRLWVCLEGLCPSSRCILWMQTIGPSNIVNTIASSSPMPTKHIQHINLGAI